jgi:phosphatidylserine/phosphatidylglycerophosphate/cardiolipin synthase-like enzyme
LAEDFIRRWNAGEGDGPILPYPQTPAAAAAGAELKIQYVKTDQLSVLAPSHPRRIPVRDYAGTLNATLQAVREARHYICMENQYMRDQDLADAIAAALKSNSILQVILVIPFITEEAAKIKEPPPPAVLVEWWEWKGCRDRANLHGDYLQNKFIKKLSDLAPDRVGVYGLAKEPLSQPPATLPPEQIYPHAKTMVVDDTWAYIGSANANGRSFRLDGESGYIIHDRAIVTAYRKSLWEEHLGGTAAALETREIRGFRKYWDSKALKNKKGPEACVQGELQHTAAVEITDPPVGLKYNGPGSWLKDIHNWV